MASTEETPVPLPSAKPFNVAPNIVIQPPLSRRGDGPGLILLVGEDQPLHGHEKTLDPPPLAKWAEEGYAVSQITLSGSKELEASQIAQAVSGLQNLKECTSKGDAKFGVISTFDNDHSVQ